MVDIDPRGFGNALQAARKQRQLSQDQLAKATGLHRTHISLLERGRREPSLETLVKLCRALNVSPAEAITWHVPGPERHAEVIRQGPQDHPNTTRRRALTPTTLVSKAPHRGSPGGQGSAPQREPRQTNSG